MKNALKMIATLASITTLIFTACNIFDTEDISAFIFAGDGGDVACYWKDGVKTDLPAGLNYSSAQAIAVSGGSIYIAGYYDNDKGTQYAVGPKNIACYWKDGVKTDLYTNGAERSEANAIAVSGGSVYIAGHYNDNACYWKDGVKIDLPVESDYSVDGYTKATAIAVSGRSVHIAGYYQKRLSTSSHAFYWKDGIPISLGSSSYAKAIAVSGGSVYIAGWYYAIMFPLVKGCYWKDGVKTDIQGGFQVNAIAALR
jgi:hypothetical protein